MWSCCIFMRSPGICHSAASRSISLRGADAMTPGRNPVSIASFSAVAKSSRRSDVCAGKDPGHPRGGRASASFWRCETPIPTSVRRIRGMALPPKLVYVKTPILLEHPGPPKTKNPVITRIYGVFRTSSDCSELQSWCPREDSNLHALRRMDLNHVRLPIPPPGQGACAAKNAIISGRVTVSSNLGPKLKCGSEPLPIWLASRCGPVGGC
jgi:hypothetical protein